MKEITGNLFDYIGSADAICITTNGFVKKNGECVMGKGCAKEAAKRYPKISRALGNAIRTNGNQVHTLARDEGTWICSFPVKPTFDVCKEDKSNVVKHMTDKMTEGFSVPGWACKANPNIIEASARQLSRITDEQQWTKVVLPRPGCGAGELDWKDIRSLLEQYLDDRFLVITFD